MKDQSKAVWTMIEYALTQIDEKKAHPKEIINGLLFLLAYLGNRLDIPDIRLHKMLQQRIKAISDHDDDLDEFAMRLKDLTDTWN